MRLPRQNCVPKLKKKKKKKKKKNLRQMFKKVYLVSVFLKSHSNKAVVFYAFS